MGSDSRASLMRAMMAAGLLTLFSGAGQATLAQGEIHIVHCLKGCPTGTPATNDLVVRQIYALSSNDETKFADWVAYVVTRETIGTSKDLKRVWRSDPDLEGDETLEKGDYTGANDAFDYERGHLAPLASFAGTIFWRDTNYLSNIAPQKDPLNGGSWLKLEDAVRDRVWNHGDTWVLTGTLYESQESALPQSDESHRVPSAFWKVVSNKTGKISAFIFDQDLPESVSHCDQRVSLSEVEGRTGLNLFPDAPTSWPTGHIDSHLGC